MNDSTATLAKEEVECRKCHARYVPSFMRDFYPDGSDPKVGLCESCKMRSLSPANEPHPLDDARAEKLCKRGQGAATCAFLSFGADGFACTKGSSFEAAVRQRIASGTMKSKGDNCSGPPNFTTTTK